MSEIRAIVLNPTSHDKHFESLQPLHRLLQQEQQPFSRLKGKLPFWHTWNVQSLVIAVQLCLLLKAFKGLRQLHSPETSRVSIELAERLSWSAWSPNGLGMMPTVWFG